MLADIFLGNKKTLNPVDERCKTLDLQDLEIL